ncbi:hypothetical protein U4960_10740 [Altererythrobacter sp. H2]|uniref:hypothetical protein n=1 Tax=Altererythrobacter sp. H2 TaxID=3108391 RepID=UPI002B4BBF95|nr:hypothetical protein [Altererythrobacter sp. H2]WRK94774.1 hypothetical protein U4960_10740 [Altererythrobacter sp. H2]
MIGAISGFFAVLTADEFLTGLLVGLFWLFLIPGFFAVAAMFFDYVVLDQPSSPTKKIQEFHFHSKDFEVYTLNQYQELERVIARTNPDELENISAQISRKIGRNTPNDPQSFLMSYYIQFRAYLLAVGKL